MSSSVKVSDFTTKELFEEISKRGGHPGALADAALLCIRKSEDYNQGMGIEDIHRVNRDSYFPFGLMSYAQVLHTKTQRLNSLAIKGAAATNFESATDTMLDIINYAGFAADWLKNRA
jgi:hypothetical protein